MRILQVMAGNEHGGAETAFVDMCIAMHQAGESIEVVTRKNEGRVPLLQKAGIKVHILPFGGAIDIFTPLCMKKIICAFKPDIVQTWMSRAAAKTPRWTASMGIPRYYNFARLGGYYKVKYFQNMDFFVTITPDLKRHLVESGIEEGRVRHINNFAETEDVIEPLNRVDYGVPENALLLLGLGRLHQAKAFDILIKAVAALPDVYLWIAGEGPLRAELEALIGDLKVNERVRLLGWRNDRAALLQASDICFFSSRYEPFGTVFVQAWAQETPLITTLSQGPKQFVRHEEDCLAVEIDDLEGFKAAIKRLRDDKKLADKIVQNGKKRYLNEFTKEKCVQAYLDYYHHAADQQNQAA
ncbi:MAG: glycosyltransferase [Alphaproteobacteria bacterium]